MSNHERAIFREIEQCEIGMALTKGKLRQRYAKHRKACFAELHRMSVQDGLANLTDDQILAELTGE